MRSQPNIVADQILMLITKYSEELRSSAQPSRLKAKLDLEPEYSYRPDDALVRENLMEHVGMLPVLAVEIFPYLQDKSVDLGQSLVLLAIHDIGELLVGDVNTYVKLPEHSNNEHAAARSLLHPVYHELYLDMETRGTSSTVKFARSIDKLAPDIFECLLPVQYSIDRLGHFAKLEPEQIMPAIIKRSRPHMSWNPFMSELHQVVCDRLGARLIALKE